MIYANERLTEPPESRYVYCRECGGEIYELSDVYINDGRYLCEDCFGNLCFEREFPRRLSLRQKAYRMGAKVCAAGDVMTEEGSMIDART